MGNEIIKRQRELNKELTKQLDIATDLFSKLQLAVTSTYGEYFESKYDLVDFVTERLISDFYALGRDDENRS